LRKATNAKFPVEVHKHFNLPYEADAETRAKFHTYNESQHVIHAIGPKVKEVLWGVHDLALTYLNVLVAFCEAIGSSTSSAKSVPRTLRLLPISSGIFLTNKRLERHMPQITWSALSLAFVMMPLSLQERMKDAVVEVCIFQKFLFGPYNTILAAKKALVTGPPKISENLGRAPQKYGSYDWVRQKNSPSDRLDRLGVLLSTAQALSSGGYTFKGKSLTLNVKDVIDGTRLRRPGATPARPASCRPGAKTKVVFDSDGLTVMEAAIKSTKAGRKTIAVNAASAYSVGGGVLCGGRHALEESFCTMSTLLPSLQQVKWESKVLDPAVNHSNVGGNLGVEGEPEQRCAHIPLDGCITSPDVEIFRSTSAQGYAFQEAPTKILGVCSVAMFNMNPRVSDSPLDAPDEFKDYCAQVKLKFQTVVAAAVRMGAEVLICPDVGCGVFMNDPVVIGTLFGETLHELQGYIPEIIVTGKVSFFEAAKRAADGGKVALQQPANWGMEKALQTDAPGHRRRGERAARNRGQPASAGPSDGSSASATSSVAPPASVATPAAAAPKAAESAPEPKVVGKATAPEAKAAARLGTE